ncbi:MAG TPA: HEXXH motif-containing putative peptide modification protein [Candidatus Polarisedimenticolia bacterium]|nr:HEXXH motif-containing putative peptide modification protein [Candidatus Polarisedimenticolia bacterium]
MRAPLPLADFRHAQRKLRAGQIRRILRQDWGKLPGAARSLSLLREGFDADSLRSRRCLFDSPLLDGWIQDVLFWREARERSRRLESGRGTRSDQTRLFDMISGTEFLAEVVPAGRLDSLFARRAAARAQSILEMRMADLPRILWPHLPARRSIRLRFPILENPDEGCPAGWLRLGMTRALIERTGTRKAGWLDATLKRGTLSFGAGVEMRMHEVIPGTSILLSHRLLSRGHSLKVGARVPGLGRRLARALALVDRAWPDAGEEIRRRTWMIVPLVERGTVSYSHLARPGISYLNVSRGGLVDLADDLLHETSHHRLHARQEISPFATDDGEPRFYSPWRRALRPLNGILHGSYTFLFRAELFQRLLRSRRIASAGKRAWIARELRKEIESCGLSLSDLAGARREGLLTAKGVSLLHGMGLWHARLSRGRLSGDGHFCIF